MNIEWSPGATALARQYMHDQDGMRAMGAAVAALAVDPWSLSIESIAWLLIEGFPAHGDTRNVPLSG